MVERGAMGEDEVEEDQEQQLRQRRVRDNGIVGRTGSFDSPRGDKTARWFSHPSISNSRVSGGCRNVSSSS